MHFVELALCIKNFISIFSSGFFSRNMNSVYICIESAITSAITRPMNKTKDTKNVSETVIQCIITIYGRNMHIKWKECNKNWANLIGSHKADWWGELSVAKEANCDELQKLHNSLSFIGINDGDDTQHPNEYELIKFLLLLISTSAAFKFNICRRRMMLFKYQSQVSTFLMCIAVQIRFVLFHLTQSNTLL